MGGFCLGRLDLIAPGGGIDKYYRLSREEKKKRPCRGKNIGGGGDPSAVGTSRNREV